MLKERSRLLRKVQLLVDLTMTALSFYGAYLLRSEAGLPLPPVGPFSSYLTVLYVIVPLWAILLHYHGAYDSIRTQSLYQTVWPVLKTVLTGGIILTTMLFMMKLHGVSRTWIFLFLLINAIVLVAERFCLYATFRYIRTMGMNYRNVLIVGTGKRARAFAENLFDHKEWGLRLAGFIDTEPALVGQEIFGKEVVGLIGELPDILARGVIDEVVFLGPRTWADQIEGQLLVCETMGVKARLPCDFFRTPSTKVRLDALSDWPFLTFTPPPHYGNLFAVKRGADVLVSLAVLILASPLFLLIALGITFTSRGPVFFVQERCGLYGRRFKLLKFRTMVDHAEQMKSKLHHLNMMSGPTFKAPHDPRITPFGRFLRKYSLDEFPQFLNVIEGDMSIVGPRPPILEEVQRYDVAQRRRLSVRPGMTCLWQISGRNHLDFRDWVKLDLDYIDRWSLGLDMAIVLKTIPAVLKGRGI